jgi:glutathione peroxidase
MNFRRTVLALILAAGGAVLGATTVLDFLPLSIDGKPTPLAAYRGKVLLIVNVASRSNFTPQFEGLQSLYEKYESQGLVILAFPANDFGQEEPGNNDDIKQIVNEKYKITFPLFAKISAAGDHAAPLFQFLADKQTNPTTGGPIRWNFTKFLIDREGKILLRFEPDVEPLAPELVAAIEKALRAEPAKHEAAAAASISLESGRTVATD